MDIAFDFGKLSNDKIPIEPNSYAYRWINEYTAYYPESFFIREGVVLGFESLTNGDDGGIIKTFSDIQGPINDIKTSIENVKDQVSDIIINYSDTIDEYGKLGFKIVFSVLTVFVAAIAAIMLVLCFCSGKKCSSCCLFRCGFRIILHILWNILAFLTFFVLLLGAIFTLFGTVGKDLISVVSFLVSDENLNKEEPILLEGAPD